MGNHTTNCEYCGVDLRAIHYTDVCTVDRRDNCVHYLNYKKRVTEQSATKLELGPISMLEPETKPKAEPKWAAKGPRNKAKVSSRNKALEKIVRPIVEGQIRAFLSAHPSGEAYPGHLMSGIGKRITHDICSAPVVERIKLALNGEV